MNLSAMFFANKENYGEHDIDNLQDLLEKAIDYSDEAFADNENLDQNISIYRLCLKVITVSCKAGVLREALKSVKSTIVGKWC